MLQPDGKAVVAGAISNGASDNPVVARFDANGSLGSGGWTSLSSVGGSAYDVGLQSTGKVVVTAASGFVARFTANVIRC